MNKNDSENLVWYVAYGSNLLIERFYSYLKGIKFEDTFTPEVEDDSDPVDIQPFDIPYPLYFAERSRTWHGGGVAFLDHTTKGYSYGRAYLITYQQYLHVKRHEGEWYQHECSLGEFKGYPALTFTSEIVKEANKPSPEYVAVIAKGLKQQYPELDDYMIHNYLLHAIKRKNFKNKFELRKSQV